MLDLFIYLLAQFPHTQSLPLAKNLSLPKTPVAEASQHFLRPD
jgi:hypothetical protein